MLLNSLARRSKVRDPTAFSVVRAQPGAPAIYGNSGQPAETMAMKLSAVDRCVTVLTGSMSKLPIYLVNTVTREREDHDILKLLNVRPNEAMTPSIRKQVLEGNRLLRGNGYEWIVRDPYTRRPVELIPLPENLVQPWIDVNGHVWYDVLHPLTGEPMTLSGEDVGHYKGYTGNGLKGISVLQRASEVIAAGRAAQAYGQAFFEGDAQPSGILSVEGDLSGNSPTRRNADGSPMSKKDVIREEWAKNHSGPNKAHRIAILDYGLKYQAISTTPADAKYIEAAEMTVLDIARFFAVPPYKLYTGKQSYNSNEQNAIGYVCDTLHPTITQYDEEMTYKLLLDSAISAGKRLCINMMAELKGDTASRGTWYKNMRESGAYTANEIRRLEDLPDKEGGDELYASWNYGPLSKWAELSVQRAGGGNKK